MRSFPVRGALEAFLRFCRRSFRIFRRTSSASCRVRLTLAFAAAMPAERPEAPGLGVASCVFSMMWRNRKLPTTPVFDVFGFFAAGCASALTLTSFGGKKQTWASSSCGGTSMDFARSIAMATISPHAARGCILNSDMASMSSSRVSTLLMAEPANIKNGWTSGPLNSTLCTSGVQRSEPPPVFLAGSPRKREAPAWLPSCIGCTLPSTVSASHAPQRPSVAMKMWLPRSSATAAPQPSSTCGFVAR
mmetsp:Transcript_29447/g.82260  ORF Transcript_29447/g.82260 Transcript_29447/m.82260 type:complete len:247 (-) Transcript_29447:619-1359(-)